MKRGEKAVWGLAGLITLAALYAGVVVYKAPPKLMPTYQLESPQAARGELVYRKQSCSACHRIWNLGGHKGGVLDGIGSRRSVAWLDRYLSTDNPQEMLPSSRKEFYQMPSFAALPDDKRADLVAYLSSLKTRQDDTAQAPDEAASGEHS